jgi:hypothetical protein
MLERLLVHSTLFQFRPPADKFYAQSSQLQNISKLRVFIPQIAQNLGTFIQLRILLSIIPPPILNPVIPLQRRTRHESQKRQSQTCTKPRLILRTLVRDENITAYQIPTIAKSDHKARRECRFGVSAHVVRDPNDEEGHLDVS